MPTLSKQDLKAIIRDQVRSALAAQMLDGEERAREDFRRRQLDGDLKGADVGAVIAAEARKAGFDFPRALGDRARGVVYFDPHKGRGLEFARAVKAMAVGAMERRSPAAVAKDWASQNRAYEQISRALSEGSYGAAGALVPPEMSAEFIELLYAATVALEMGARTIEFKGALQLGKQGSSATTYYVGEASNITPSQPGVVTLELKARKLASLVALTNELLRNPSAGADVFVRDDLLRIMALRRDLSIFRGAGTEHQPRGITNWVNSANKNAQSGTALANKVADLIKAISLVDGADVPLTRPGWVCAPRTKWALMSTLDSNGNHVFLPMLATGTLYGFPIKCTSQIPINLGGGANESEIYFGEFPEVLVGFDQQLEIETFLNGTYFDGSSLVSGISSDQSVIRALERHDVVLRHDKSFSMVTGVTWTA